MNRFAQNDYSRWQPAFAEYLEAFRQGYYSKDGQHWLVFTEADLISEERIGALFVGGLGVGGIMFGFREGMDGIWVFYPIEEAWEYKTATIAKFVEGWESSEITV